MPNHILTFHSSYFGNIFSKFYYHILSLNSASHFSIFSAAYDVFYSLWQNLYSFWETLEISFVILQRETKNFFQMSYVIGLD